MKAIIFARKYWMRKSGLLYEGCVLFSFTAMMTGQANLVKLENFLCDKMRN